MGAFRRQEEQMCSSTWHAEVGKERNALGSLHELITKLQKPVNNTNVTMWKPQAGGALHECFGLNLQ